MNYLTRKKQRDHAEIEPSEEALIGSILIDPSAIDRIGPVSPESFFVPELGQLLGLIQKRQDAGLPIDPILLHADCQSIGLDISRADLARLFLEVPHAKHAPFYGGNVVEAARLRKLIELQNSLGSFLSDRTRNSDSIINELEKSLDGLRQDTQAGQQTIHSAGLKLIQECEVEKNKKRSAETGIWAIDSAIGGMMPGELIVLAARPGIGKTSLAMQIAIHNATKNRKALFVSLEMRAEELAGRVFGGLSNVDSSDLRSRNLSGSQLQQLRESVETMASMPLIIFDPAQASIRDIRGQAKQAGDLSLIVVDYVSLIKPADSRAQRWEQVSDISRQLKRLAKELRVPILALQQLNREADGQVPKLSHLRESGSIEQDSDIIGFLHPEGTETFYDFIVAKNRHGRTGTIDLRFDGPKTQFSERGGTEGKP